MSLEWYVLRVATGREQETAERLNTVVRRQFPNEFNRAVRPVGVDGTLMFPRYLMLNAELWPDVRHSILSTIGVMEFPLCQPMSQHEVDCLLNPQPMVSINYSPEILAQLLWLIRHCSDDMRVVGVDADGFLNCQTPDGEPFDFRTVFEAGQIPDDH